MVDMSRKPYRVEVNYPKRGKPKYFLVKDVRVRGKKRKVRKYLGIIPPTADEIEAYRQKFAYEMEIKAATKRAEISISFFSLDHLSRGQVRKLEEIRYIYKAVTELLTINEIGVYENDFEIHYIQGTTVLEGNTLTLKQAHDLLVNNIAPKGKSLREINEVQNFKKVVRYRNQYRGKVSIDFIKTLHALIMDNIDYESAGTFRRVNDIGIAGCEVPLCPSIFIEDELNIIIKKYYSDLNNGKHPFEAAVMFHYEFEMIHPFTDANGRVGRELFNYMLIRERFPKLLFLGKDRELYIDALKLGNEENYGEMIHIFSNLIIKQRLDILKENLKRVATPIKKSGQLRLTDFVSF